MVKTFHTNRYIVNFSPKCLNEFLPNNYTILKLYRNRTSGLPIIVSVKELRKAVQEDLGLPIRATAYITDDTDYSKCLSAFLLLDKIDDFSAIRWKLEQKYKSLLVKEIEQVSFDKNDNGEGISKAALFQLMVGLMNNNYENIDEGDVFNNTMGKTLVWDNDRAFKDKWLDKTQHYSNGVPTWHGKIFTMSDTHIAIEMKIYNDGVIYPIAAPFVKTSPEMAKKADLYFPYIEDGYGRIVPLWRNKRNKEKLFWYRQGQAQHPAQIPFLSYDSFKKFRISRMGFLSNFLEQLDEEFGNGRENGPLMTIEPFDGYSLDDIKEITVKDKSNDNIFFNSCLSMIGKKFTVSWLDDVVMTEKEKNGYDLLCETLHEKGIKKFDTAYDPKKLNIVIHHEADFYGNDKEKDLARIFRKNHQNEIIQGITVENLKFDSKPMPTGNEEDDQKAEDKYNNDKNSMKRKLSYMIDVCIISLAIKQCIIKKKTNVLMTALPDSIKQKFKQPVSAAIKVVNRLGEKYNKMKNPLYCILRLDMQSGDITFRHFLEDEAACQRKYAMENRMIQNGFNVAGDIHNLKNYDPNVEMIVWTDIEDIYQIRLTDEHIIPNIHAIRKNLKDTNKKMNKDVFKQYLMDFKDTFDENELEEVNLYESIVLQKLEKETKNPVPYANLQKCLSANEKGCRRIYNEFSSFLKNEKGVILDAGIRNKENEEEYGVLNFNKIIVFPTPPKLNESRQNSYTYIVGSKENLLRGGIAKGLPLRNIIRRNGGIIDENFVIDLLSMTTVDFVRLNQYTVRPFLMKLLNEYAPIVLLTLENNGRIPNLGELMQLPLKFEDD